jgi:signal transduction histidine kinase/CheY-like chemotaxis protein
MYRTLPGKIEHRLRSWRDRIPTALGIAFDLVDPDGEHAGAIRGEQIRAIVRLTPVVMIASGFNAAILLATWSSIARPPVGLWVWTALILAAVAYHFRNWLRSRAWAADRPASRRALRRTVLHACVFGVLWGVLPAFAFADAPHELQLLLACLIAGMMCAGGFVLATAPLAGIAYVLLVAGGATVALMQQADGVRVGIMALLAVYTLVIIASINWSATLFVSSRLSEARVRREVTARELAQEQAMHAERLAALGQLAGGIAHDFNNILQAISGSAALIARHPADQGYVRRQSDRILDAVERGSAISGRLLAFARRDVLSAEVIEAGAMLEELRELLIPTLGGSIEVRLESPAPSPSLRADPRQLETVLVNLAANARDAMPTGGVLTLAARSELVEPHSARHGLQPGRYVRLSLTDSGAGMDPATLARAAEPFFTTKPRGQGTGLGVSMAKGFAEQSGGAFEIASEPRKGATVTLWLPEAEPARPVGQAAPAAHPAGAHPPGRRVLVVDDDELVREMLMANLQDAGLETIGAPSGNDALAQLDGGAEIDAVVTDLSMPGISGWDLISELRARGLEIPVLMVTGHVDAAEPAMNLGRFQLLQKPVSPDQLSQRLTALMG